MQLRAALKAVERLVTGRRPLRPLEFAETVAALRVMADAPATESSRPCEVGELVAKAVFRGWQFEFAIDDGPRLYCLIEAVSPDGRRGNMMQWSSMAMPSGDALTALDKATAAALAGRLGLLH
jgi:hypothetical protein